jgi:predicted AlkP superfamily phosphohydrolase/phosphomutase/tetratricopeptide (TPR) repeat protein
MAKKRIKKLLLIGWDAADWKAIRPLMAAGHMPVLQKMMQDGVYGPLVTLDPPLSPMLWTSISSGKRPFKHGIHGFTEPDPSGTAVRPVHITSRKVKAIWNILTQKGYKTHQVGWWPSHPAEPVNGVYISNFYQNAPKPITEPWPMLAGTVHPKEKEELFAALRVHPHELSHAHLLPFVPDAAKLDQRDPRVQSRINSLRKVIADCSTIHSAVTYILENEEWDFTGVYYDAIDHFCHGFMKFNPPRRTHVDEKEYEMYKGVVSAGYRYHDMMLGRLLQLAGEDATVILISDHGFHPDHNRPKEIPKEPAGPAAEHSPFGIVVMKGPGIKKGGEIHGAGLLDITPTILSLFGLPVGQDMDGFVIANAFAEAPGIETIPSWEEVPGECGMHPPDLLEDPYAAKEALQQLVELGYIEAPDENVEVAIKKTTDENNFYLARSYIHAGKFEEAIPIFFRLFDENPDALRYGIQLAQCYLQQDDTAEARKVVQKIRATQKEPSPALLVLQGLVVMNEQDPEKALGYFRQAATMEEDHPKIYLHIANCLRQLERWEEAREAYQKELEVDPEEMLAWLGSGICELRLKEYEAAAEKLMNAIGFVFYTPSAHYHLGETLFHLGNFEGAAQAFEICLHMSPGLLNAREWAIRIYSEKLGMPEKAKTHQEALVLAEVEEGTATLSAGSSAAPLFEGIPLHQPDAALPEIVIVSGLPRSGTSMMMQMLEEGGIAVFTDKKRTADESNPKGYYEHEAIKGLMKENAFLQDAEGKAVKVISQLLSYMPAGYRYKVLFMQRSLDEVLSSQERMLDRDGKVQQADTKKLRTAYQQALNKVSALARDRKDMQFLAVPYSGVVENPEEQARRVSEFLGQDLDTASMAGVVDPALYRERM